MRAVILGAGPAGLTSAYELTRQGVACEVVEREKTAGGLCRTLDYEGYLFDIGGHRFLSRSVEVNALWKAILGDNLLTRQRKSRIYYRGNFFDYPLKPWDALKKMGPVGTLKSLVSYAGAQLRPPQDLSSFENWMIRRFGRHLYESFFKTYTEKVWGISCRDLSSDWADQRIQQLSLRKAVLQAFTPTANRRIKTLTESFGYPRKGPGQFYEMLKDACEEGGARFNFSSSVKKIMTEGSRISAVIVSSETGTAEYAGDHYLASIPITNFIKALEPEVPANIREAVNCLQFRGFISVNLIYDVQDLFDDNWIYLHSPDVSAGRIQNYKNWSPEMVPAPETTSLGVEYFCSPGDNIWRLDDRDMIQLAVDELEQLGIVERKKYIKGFCVRVPHAYPIYRPGYREALQQLHGYLSNFKNLQMMGRAGLFRYNNSDHAILTGLNAARNVMGEQHDLWSIDPDRVFTQVRG